MLKKVVALLGAVTPLPAPGPAIRYFVTPGTSFQLTTTSPSPPCAALNSVGSAAVVAVVPDVLDIGVRDVRLAGLSPEVDPPVVAPVMRVLAPPDPLDSEVVAPPGS